MCSRRAVDLSKLRRQEEALKHRQAGQYNKRHRVQPRNELSVGRPVVVRDTGTVRRGELVAVSGREVAVQAENGNILRRNRAAVAETHPVTAAESAPHQSPDSGEQDMPDRNTSQRHDVVRQYEGIDRSTRGGRVITAPVRLDL